MSSIWNFVDEVDEDQIIIDNYIQGTYNIII